MTDSDPGYPIYPVGLRLAGRRAVVVGGGPVAERRARGLFEAGADVAVISSSVTPGLRELADSRRLQWHQRRYQAGDLAVAWYAVAATSSPEINAAIQAEAEQRRLFCVRADDASQATAWTLAAGQHGGLTVAVAGGRDPRRAARVRDAILAALADGTIDDRPHRV